MGGWAGGSGGVGDGWMARVPGKRMSGGKGGWWMLRWVMLFSITCDGGFRGSRIIKGESQVWMGSVCRCVAKGGGMCMSVCKEYIW